jgi:hypothetical protein
MILSLSFAFRRPILAGLVFARVGHSFSDHFLALVHSTTRAAAFRDPLRISSLPFTPYSLLTFASPAGGVEAHGAGGSALTLEWPTVCGFVSCKRWVTPLSYSGIDSSAPFHSSTKPSQSRRLFLDARASHGGWSCRRVILLGRGRGCRSGLVRWRSCGLGVWVRH